MSVAPEILAELRQIGLERRRMSLIERTRGALAPYIDTGDMTDEDVRTAFAALKSGFDQPPEGDIARL